MVKKVTKPVADEVDEAPVKKAVKKTEDTAPVKKAVKKEKETNEDNTSLSAICDDLGIDQRAARVRLRKSEFNKGDGRWTWATGSDEHKAVVEFLTPKEKAEPKAKAEKAAPAKKAKAKEVEPEDEGEDDEAEEGDED